MTDMRRKAYERNGIETIVDNYDYGILWLNEIHIKEGWDHKNLREITIKYQSDHKKHRYGLVGERKKQVNKIFIDDKWAIKVIMNCRTTSAPKFRFYLELRLGFKQYDVILTKKQSVLTKLMTSCEGESMQTQYNVLSDRIDLYFHDYKLSIEIDKNGPSDTNIDCEIKRQKSTEKELGCNFIRIVPEKEYFDIFSFRATNEIFTDIKQSTKKPLINKISTRLLWLDFKSDNITKSKAIKVIV